MVIYGIMSRHLSRPEGEGFNRILKIDDYFASGVKNPTPFAFIQYLKKLMATYRLPPPVYTPSLKGRGLNFLAFRTASIEDRIYSALLAGILPKVWICRRVNVDFIAVS